MADPTGESKSEALRLNFDRRLLLQFRGSLITSDGGLLAYRELDDVVDLTTSGGGRLAETRTGKNRGIWWSGYCGSRYLAGSPAMRM
jgi:hypothetical protein